MRRKYVRIMLAGLLVLGGVAFASSASQASIGSESSGSDSPTVVRAARASKIVNPGGDNAAVARFWTKSRIKKAKPRDFIFNPASRKFRPAPSRRFKLDMFTNLGSSWTSGGPVARNTGKVFFALGTQYYVCSGTVVYDGANDRSVVVTAAHCAYDETNNIWASNWMFVPDYDAAPVSLTTSGSFCADTSYGCWTARSLIVPRAFASQSSFNADAAKHDYAFAVLGAGGKGNTQLDAVVGAQSIDFVKRDLEANTWLFGYPAQGRYKGIDLMYCKGLIGYDRAIEYETYRLPCRLTGGSSGGPWMSPFSDSGSTVGTGTVMSVTSYGYAGIKALYGPIFNDETLQMFALSWSLTSGNVLYPQT